MLRSALSLCRHQSLVHRLSIRTVSSSTGFLVGDLNVRFLSTKKQNDPKQNTNTISTTTKKEEVDFGEAEEEAEDLQELEAEGEILSPHQINRQRRLEAQAKKRRLQATVPLDATEEPLKPKGAVSAEWAEENRKKRFKSASFNKRRTEQDIASVKVWASSVLGISITNNEATEFLRAFTHPSHPLGTFFNNSVSSLHGKWVVGYITVHEVLRSCGLERSSHQPREIDIFNIITERIKRTQKAATYSPLVFDENNELQDQEREQEEEINAGQEQGQEQEQEQGQEEKESKKIEVEPVAEEPDLIATLDPNFVRETNFLNSFDLSTLLLVQSYPNRIKELVLGLELLPLIRCEADADIMLVSPDDNPTNRQMRVLESVFYGCVSTVFRLRGQAAATGMLSQILGKISFRDRLELLDFINRDHIKALNAQLLLEDKSFIIKSSANPGQSIVATCFINGSAVLSVSGKDFKTAKTGAALSLRVQKFGYTPNENDRKLLSEITVVPLSEEHSEKELHQA